MLSADPLPRSEQRAWCADKCHGLRDQSAFLRIDWISNFTLRVCTPIFWHDRRHPFPKMCKAHRASFYGSTSAPLGSLRITLSKPITLHVHKRPIVCQVRLAEFDLDAALIDRDLRLDLATFAVRRLETRQVQHDFNQEPAATGFTILLVTSHNFTRSDTGCDLVVWVAI
jgi:hypothetical protein